MTEIQEQIANLAGKIKKQTDDLIKLKQEVACAESMLDNNMMDLKKIIESIELK